jgi:hypothetical protein
MMYLKHREKATRNSNRTADAGEQNCAECGQPCYRIIVVADVASQPRKLSLCGRHFIEALRKYPQLENKSNNRGMINRVAFVSA